MLQANGIGVSRKIVEGIMSEERLKKLIALRDGTNKPGERAAAQAAIDRLLDKGHQLPEEKKLDG